MGRGSAGPLVFAAAVTLALVAPSSAERIPGGGNAKSDCYAEIDVAGIRNPSERVEKNRIVLCTDGDPCDTGPCGDDQCDVQVALCINQTDANAPGCTPPSGLDDVRAKPRGKVRIDVESPPSLEGPTCGARSGGTIPVKLARKGRPKAPGRARIGVTARAPRGTRPRRDEDTFTIKCVPRTAACPSVCGDGQVTGGEQCDPPCGQGQCGAGTLCDASCQCTPASTCTCGTPEPARFEWKTTEGVGSCGAVTDASGAAILDLPCNGLFFGGGTSAVTLPAFQPDTGTTIMNTCCSGSTLTLAAASASETGSSRNCSSAGCSYGAPVPLPNFLNQFLSTCLVNVLSRDAVGSAQCDTGTAAISLPLQSRVHLAGDLLDGATPERPDVPGTQPCPICSRACAGGTNDGRPCAADGDCPGGACGASPVCLGGPSHAQSCTLESSLAGKCKGGTNNLAHCTTDAQCPGEISPGVPASCNIPYPTSRDCLPAPSQLIGSLAVGFALTTGTSSDTAGPAGSLQRVFCGFCRDTDATRFFGVCTGGSNAGAPCQQPNECPEATCGDELPCASDADCFQPRELCEQRNDGAFGKDAATTITMTGTPAGSISDRAEHTGTLLSAFCIPPTFAPSIDVVAALPGPGATSFPSKIQLRP